MKDLRIWVNQARTIVLEPSAARVVNFFSLRYKYFDETYREIETQLATKPLESGIRGVASDEADIGYYFHVSARMPPISVLYRYDRESVHIESVVVERQAMRAS